MIEIKPTEPKVTKAVCDIITKSDAHKRVLIGSFNTHTLKIFRDECPHVATSLGRSEITWAYILKKYWIRKFIQIFRLLGSASLSDFLILRW